MNQNKKYNYFSTISRFACTFFFLLFFGGGCLNYKHDLVLTTDLD